MIFGLFLELGLIRKLAPFSPGPPHNPQDVGEDDGSTPSSRRSRHHTPHPTHPYSPLSPFPSDDPADDLVEELVQVLESEYGHFTAAKLVAECGPEAVQVALQELPNAGDLRSPAGWITWRSRLIAKGSKPLTSRPKKSSRDLERQKYSAEYERRRGDGP